MSFSLFPFAYALAELSPVLSPWIGGEQGEKVAHQAVSIAQTLTGEKEVVKVMGSLKGDPHLLAKFQESLIKMDQELELAIYRDRDNARMRDIALAHAGRSNLRADIMVVSAACGLISCLLTITLYRSSLPGEAVGIISTVAGIFGSCLKDAYAFKFGSSRGSKLKDGKISALFLSKNG
ncbi:MAG: hypothetical protein H0X26_02015 [Alphaproteobacteria bacterium]|nr:hypothetical protein [Alphaproteobacteria bacterium]